MPVTNRRDQERNAVSHKAIGRLCVYRRSLRKLQAMGKPFVYSHELATEASVSPAQVRRVLMGIGYSGSPNRGYDTSELLRSIAMLLDSPEGEGVALVGVGNLGRAIIAYMARQRPHLFVAAAFDSDPEKIGRVIHGCRTLAVEEMPRAVREHDLHVGIVAVPSAAAQDAADRLVAAGIRGLLNFAPVPLRLPESIYVEEIDLTVSLEKAAYFARRSQGAGLT